MTQGSKKAIKKSERNTPVKKSIRLVKTAREAYELKEQRLRVAILISRPLCVFLAGFLLVQLLTNYREGLWSFALAPMCAFFAVGFGIPIFRWLETKDA
jgi:hypothetical protein